MGTNRRSRRKKELIAVIASPVSKFRVVPTAGCFPSSKRHTTLPGMGIEGIAAKNITDLLGPRWSLQSCDRDHTEVISTLKETQIDGFSPQRAWGSGTDMSRYCLPNATPRPPIF